MEEIRIKLSGLWVALMLTYLLGDVLRIFSGDFEAGQIGDMQITEAMYLGLAILMVIPVVMVFLSLTLTYRANRWANIVLAVFFFVFNLIGLPTYPSLYDQFLIIVGLVFNVLTVWYAWKWIDQELSPGSIAANQGESGGN
jgi:predicted ferric reductase